MVQAVARVHADACYTANAPIKVIGLDLERASERARERAPSRVQNAARDAAPALRGASGRDYETRKGGGGGGVPRWRRRRQRQRHKRKVVGWVTRKLREKEEGT